MTADDFRELLQPLVSILAEIALEDPTAAMAELEARAPIDGELISGVRRAAEVAAADGWLTPKEAGGVRFGRVAKDLGGFSIDAVLMNGPGPEHVHPRGEIDLCFAQDGEPQFDGRPAGWVCYGPGSQHVPTVRGGSMLILYFLPGGEIAWV